MGSETFGRDESGVRTAFWGAYAADLPADPSKEPGDLYFNTTSRTMKVLNETRQAWISVGPPKVGDDFIGSALDLYKWTPDVAGGGSVAMLVGADSLVDGSVRLQDTGAGGDNHAQINLGGNYCIQKAVMAVFVCRLKLNVVTAAKGTRIRAILHNTGDFNDVGDWFGFEFSAAVNANWKLRSTVGGAGVQENATVNVAPVATVTTVLMIVMCQGIAYAYVDGVLIGTISAARLTAAQLEPLVYADDGAVAPGTAINCDMDYVYVYQ
jgi:hypothetical protein